MFNVSYDASSRAVGMPPEKPSASRWFAIGLIRLDAEVNVYWLIAPYRNLI